MEIETEITGNAGQDAQVLDKAKRLFTFLRELSALRTNTIRNLDQYDRVLWLKDIPREKGCYSVAWHMGEDDEPPEVWIEISKPSLKVPPTVPSELRPWLGANTVHDSSQEAPPLF